MKRLVLFALLLLIANRTQANLPNLEEGTSLKVSGKVIDQATSLPLAFANIIYNQTGTTTNLEGEFVFQINYHRAENLLLIKFIGYETAAIPLSHDNTNLSVNLIPKAEMLEEVVVVTADQVLKDVNNYHQINYEYSDQLLSSYYKETLSTDKDCIYLAEGIFDIYYPTVYSKEKPTIHARKTRKKNFADLDTMYMPLIHGHATDMINGVTRRTDSFIKKERLDHYTFTKEGLTWYDGKEVFQINFEPKSKKGDCRGTIYIDSESKAIIRTEYEPLLDGQNFWKKAKWTEEYKEVNSSWYIHRVSYLGEWDQHGRTVTFEALLVVTDFETITSKPELTQSLTKNDIFFHQASTFSESFWDDFNYIKLSTKEKHALGY
ncbi:CarboxypepD_reg-like domain-containing protein [Reichenbachiella faecimaris]|uniref:CarboxypepD_reg-like domain-containing protein n=1 Tax=Reichenbachiella faecimaris TaxID=692418 RepID=A0A1W2G6P0_REIFA|nr:carboxypeptidase-like regulatory domain-containing protein [Reichenbachiella faecimaris]SMD32340.1 CarboxypepD_reg-like domain-containing protein [Reichenbachiella faecimaris]